MFDFLNYFFWRFFRKKNIFLSKKTIRSKYLNRSVELTILMSPLNSHSSNNKYPLLLLNDGQDIPALQLPKILERLVKQKHIPPILVVGIHAGDRMQEYGTAGIPDYQNRGSRASAYTNFITKELLPYLTTKYNINTTSEKTVMAGFSLGGLSAMDIVFNNATTFGKVGVFSGSFWWRSKAFEKNDPDANLIMHEIVRKKNKKENLQFWFQTGTNDEKDDRNNNGIIDAIDDTLQLIEALKEIGYSNKDITYLEIKDGEHNPTTWGKAMPKFLIWAFGQCH